MYTVNQMKLRDWMDEHRIFAREVAAWWECSGSYVAKLRTLEGCEPSAQFAQDVGRCMKENVPAKYRNRVRFKFEDWYRLADEGDR